MKTPLAALRFRLDQRWQRWLDGRTRPASSITLDQSRIYIVPSAAGGLFGAMLLVMLLTAINYQNNSIYLLTFFLAGIFVITIHATYANMAGLRIARLAPEPGFAGEEISFRVLLASSRGEPHQAITLGWRGQPAVTGNVGKSGEQVMTLYVRAPRRGLLRPGRLLVGSRYPFGLVKTWTWVDLDLTCPVYPRPVALEFQPHGADPSDHSRRSVAASEDLADIRPWREGDVPRRILWKAYARTGKLLSREYAEPVLDARWLDWDALEGVGDEHRLSALAQAALDLHAGNCEYGLRLPGQTISPAGGAAHLEQVLTALALYKATEYGLG